MDSRDEHLSMKGDLTVDTSALIKGNLNLDTSALIKGNLSNLNYINTSSISFGYSTINK